MWEISVSPNTSCMISFECQTCGHQMLASTQSPGATIEMLAEILNLPGVSLQVHVNMVGLATSLGKPDES